MSIWQATCALQQTLPPGQNQPNMFANTYCKKRLLKATSIACKKKLPSNQTGPIPRVSTLPHQHY
jgi:hypothetical protein